MTQYISKDALVAEIEKLKAYLQIPNAQLEAIKVCDNVISVIDTLKVKEVETSVIPKHSYFEEIYHCGSEPRWKIGDVLAVYEFYSDYEGEYVYGKITDVKMDETEDWCYTFENGDMAYENRLIRDETYKKN